ncbi:MAG TPA: DUF2461 domain-containing protein [Candidatus Solibacter sp.]|jgi:uncharacterized protein (TIGR02453 family)|nr:DUF2461 domain-containing protein [Candidatus Solibacter sp.]
MKSKFPGFSPEALTFLRNLQRNNRREWFQPRKERYEELIKAPMLELVGCLNDELARVAPNYVTPPQKAMYRIYRDTRFSKDKTPYKTHISGIFPRVTALKREGAVLYFHFTAKELLVFAGVYSPERDELMAYRGLLQERYDELEGILSDKTLRRTVGALQGDQLTRMPKGYSEDHPAESLLRRKQWYLQATLDVRLVTSPRILPELVKHFEIMAPFVEFMNQPFARKQKPRKMPFSVF